MTGAVWILVFTITVGIILYIGELRWRKRHYNDIGEISSESQESENGSSANAGEQEECCGLHLVCEKDSLSPMSSEILYYDDEELDRFIGREPGSYTAEETEEFREILMTLRGDDIPGWARSITQRRIELPAEIRDELLLLVNEQRSDARMRTFDG